MTDIYIEISVQIPEEDEKGFLEALHVFLTQTYGVIDYNTDCVDEV